jgi:S-adenosylmethionine uptake transporter
MVAASFFFSVMSACVYALGQCEPQMPALVVSFFRVLINMVLLVAAACWRRDVMALFGDFRMSLWARGVFGTLALMLSFSSIQLIGPGESSFLGATSGVFVALLGPLVLEQRSSWLMWAAILGAFSGVSLMFDPQWSGGELWGRVMALGGGLLSAMAYLMVALAGRSNAPETVIFYFCLVAVAIHLAYFAAYDFVPPVSVDAWLIMLFGGLSASAAQHYMTRAYQLAPAALVSAVGYLAPVLSLGWGVVLFSKIPDSKALAGCLLVLTSGVLLPFLSGRNRYAK